MPFHRFQKFCFVFIPFRFFHDTTYFSVLVFFKESKTSENLLDVVVKYSVDNVLQEGKSKYGDFNFSVKK